MKTCNLTRNFSIASLIGIVIVAVTIVYFYQSMATRAMIERENQANTDLAITIGNTIWPKYADYVESANGYPLESLAELPVIQLIRKDILHKVEGLRVVKMKIYDLNGLIAFSTQASQIGGNKSGNRGFLSARSGKSASEIIFKNHFSSFEGSIYDRNLVSSYVPVRRSFEQPVEGVFEIYSDVTPLLNDIEKNRNIILVTITSLMMMLYLFLLSFVRSAHKQIDANEMEQFQLQKQRVDYLEYHDEVTGLLNRKGLLRQMQRYVLEDRSYKVGLGVIAIKLLNLNAISGGLGHQRVIQLLRLAAERIQSCAAGGQNLSHLDSSEFIIVTENLFSEEEQNLIVDKLQQLFMEPFNIDGKSVTLTLAIGVDAAWGDKSCETLVNNALLALSESEAGGKLQSVRYEPNMELRKQEYLNLEIDVGQAVKRREFVLFYQPKIDVKSGVVSGMEALVRWRHPSRGLVMPGGFIQLLEGRGHIAEVGAWLMREACEQCKHWHDDGRSHLRVAVNVSLKQLVAPGFVESVKTALNESGLPPQSLELELTESILAEETEVVTALLLELKAVGVMLAMDDFGTGYSSLSYLMNFPFDTIKIDRSFIRDMMHNHDHAILTSAIITMAKSLKLSVVAEGVETAAQLEKVGEMGCDEVQGFYFSQAVEATKFTAVMEGIDNGTSVAVV